MLVFNEIQTWTCKHAQEIKLQLTVSYEIINYDTVTTPTAIVYTRL